MESPKGSSCPYNNQTSECPFVTEGREVLQALNGASAAVFCATSRSPGDYSVFAGGAGCETDPRNILCRNESTVKSEVTIRVGNCRKHMRTDNPCPGSVAVDAMTAHIS
jgi:hypothetical protein